MINRTNLKNNIVENLNEFIHSVFPEYLEVYAQLFIKALFIFAITFIIDFIMKKIVLKLVDFFMMKKKYTWISIFYKNRVFHAFIHFITLYIAFLIGPFIFYNHPLFFESVDKVFFLASLFLFYVLLFRLITSFEDITLDETEYKSVAIRSFSQLVKIFLIIIGVFIVFFTLFDIDLKSVLTVIGGVTAFILLVFKDPILGFVAGVQVSSSKTLKVGDWIRIPKYNLEGSITEINLVTSKIICFDKSISSIPTYDLISTEVKSYEPIRSADKRRIKKAIHFNIKSFVFLTESEITKFSAIPLLKNYLIEKKEMLKLKDANNDKDRIDTMHNLTNIGLYRKYVENYLQSHTDIADDETAIVRQLDASPNGMPLEVYCFVNTADWLKFENIQSDIFDHLLTIAKEFNLEIIQTVIK